MEENEEEAPARGPGRLERRDHRLEVPRDVSERSPWLTNLLVNMPPGHRLGQRTHHGIGLLGSSSELAANSVPDESPGAARQRMRFRRQFDGADDCGRTCSSLPCCGSADIRAVVHADGLCAGDLRLQGRGPQPAQGQPRPVSHLAKAQASRLPHRRRIRCECV